MVHSNLSKKTKSVALAMSKGVDILGELNAGRSHIVVLNVEQFSKFNSKY
jgi:hypothetical protein